MAGFGEYEMISEQDVMTISNEEGLDSTEERAVPVTVQASTNSCPIPPSFSKFDETRGQTDKRGAQFDRENDEFIDQLVKYASIPIVVVLTVAVGWRLGSLMG
ncbi:hypothetical protein GLAREA_10142 [Glarea lozoyensis ATCC 20868]|uniref:Uncharacterized protein n=1 Tax=Glarea lozoyensis (strain ATCC 20868 / MF5171) TaxID=1116229 RepID=S3E7X9_GLAL2|nr:uncharacterized protein GLAREA_10142 [Glarea lozoyensis ATCC 20868]EPE34448.1 hypothetical protein GLAREA_10142 [Glarea lozoyensis ATCC 20868]